MARISWTLLRLIAAFVGSLLLMSTGSWADEAEEGAPQAPEGRSGIRTEIEEIVVTARKREEIMQTVPVAVTAFTESQIDSLRSRDIQDIEGYAPNVIIDSVAVASQGASFYIRGIGTQEVERTFDPGVGLILDGVYLTSVFGTSIDTFDIERMEILRGPQGTLFGKNTVGGVINVVRTRPTGEFGFKGSVTLGSNDRNDYKALVNFPLLGDSLAGKLAFYSRNDDGDRRNTFLGKDAGGKKIRSYQGALLWTPMEALDVLVRYEHVDDDSDAVPLQNASDGTDLLCFALGQCIGPVDDKVRQNLPDEFEFDIDALSLEANWDFGSFLLTSISGWRDTDEIIFTDFDGTELDFFSTIRPQQHEQWSQELRVTSQFSDRHNVVAGLYYIKHEYGLQQRTLFLPLLLGAPPGTELISDQEQEAESWAGFAEYNFDITDRLGLTLGGRYTWEEKKFKGQAGTALFGISSSLSFLTPGRIEIWDAPATGKEDWTEFTYKVGIDFQATDDMLIYAYWARGFRSGGWNGRNATPADIGPYEPETVDTYEIGVKSEWFENRLRLNLSAFYNSYDDKQEEIIKPDPLLGTVTVVENAAEATLWGWEVEALAIPTRGLTLRGIVGFLDAEYDDYCADVNGPEDYTTPSPPPSTCGSSRFSGMNAITGLPQAVVDTDNSWFELRRTPELQWSVSGEYTLAVGPGEAFVTAAYRWVDNYHVESKNDYRGGLSDRGVVDVTIGYDFEIGDTDWTITLFGRDLTDELDANSAVVIGGLWSFRGVTGGRTWGLETQMKF